MLDQVTSVQFTIGKLDAGMAILLSPDHHLIEFPATILPEGVTTGSIVNVTIERNKEEETRQRDEFESIQDSIFQEYSTPPEAPEISVKSVTQTSITIQWKPLVLHSASLRGIDVYRKAQKLNIAVPPEATSCKLGGLDVNQEYQIWIIIRTSAGSFTSNKLNVKTHTLDNLTGVNVCFGMFANEGDVSSLVDMLSRIGATYTEELSPDNTHMICTIPRGPKYEMALEWNIPVVSPEFLKACVNQGKIQPAHSYYVAKS
ncbi:BRCT domain-containing protein [Polychytrium aggregatum]|uniref:BRCT domain-containing protein n=1 Tax=Polychytrium aggregatum TaxID=110093 RepID=UPI0022FE857C|nr:BRCT domain-containing protein [Polychytrium aggregatum]KAI9202270.1 BRCT domain-containing protein [Polychytrium aggregatum]